MLCWTLITAIIIASAAMGVNADPNTNPEIATFAGGCFWCIEAELEKLEGVYKVISGYSGGSEENPSYQEVSSGKTGHAEAVQVYYDPNKTSYSQLLDAFWRNINPTDASGQFNDRGDQYRTAIFWHNEDQRHLAEESKRALEQSGRYDQLIVTEILPFSSFYPAEDYHQDYAENNPLRYKFYHYLSGREEYLEGIWENEQSKPSDEELRKKLTPLQYKVTQENGTEPAFDNTYWDYHEEGIYVDVVSGEPLFSSTDKYESGTGWPSFTQLLEPDNIVERDDSTLFTTRTEVRSAQGGSHLGHVFPDGPPPTGLRYCINSAALRFVPKEQLEEEDYGQYLPLFAQ